MNDYFQYVHNLKGESRYDRFRPHTREAIVSLLLRQIEDHNTLEKTILSMTSQDVLDYVSEHLDLKHAYNNIILSTDTSSYVEEVDFNRVYSIVNLRKINNTQHPNKLFRAVNTLLPKNGIYIGRVEAYYDRKLNFLAKYGRIAGMLVWVADFFINRAMPRMNLVDKVYNYFTQGRLHSISRSELFGRLVYCGFEIIDHKIVNRMTYFVARKVREPFTSGNPSFYPIIKLPRVGRNGHEIKVYKFRTMHPYSEYIQDYMIRMNGCDETGRPAHDFRITCWGKFFRKSRLDELPQLINVLKGEMKLVGLRPLSRVRFNEFPPDLQAERIKYKPGCIPPYVALNMPGDRESMEAERIYLRSYIKSPLLTDFKFLCMGIFNILFKRTRFA